MSLIELTKEQLRNMLEKAWWRGYDYVYSDPEPVMTDAVNKLIEELENK